VYAATATGGVIDKATMKYNTKRWATRTETPNLVNAGPNINITVR